MSEPARRLRASTRRNAPSASLAQQRSDWDAVAEDLAGKAWRPKKVTIETLSAKVAERSIEQQIQLIASDSSYEKPIVDPPGGLFETSGLAVGGDLFDKLFAIKLAGDLAEKEFRTAMEES